MATFNIEINGISQSVDAVNGLLARLDALEERINSLSDVDTSAMKKSLDSLRKELENNSNNWEDISDKIQDVTKDINKLETAYKGLQNPFKAQDIKQYNTELKSVENSIKGISDEADNIGSLGTLSRDLERADAAAKDLASSLNKVQRAEDQLGTKLNVNIGGLSLQFDDVNQAIGVLEDKLYQLANSGKRSSKEFQEITNQVVSLRQAVSSVDNEIDNAFSGGLNKLINSVGSLTSIASVGEGLNQLFGIEGLDESIQKFAALSLILQGIRDIQQQLTDKASYTTKAYETLSKVATVTLSGIGKGLNTISFGAFDKLSEKVVKTADVFKQADLINQIQELTKLKDADDLGALEDLEGYLKTLITDFELVQSAKDKALDFADTSDILTEINNAFEEGLINEEQYNTAKQKLQEFTNGLSENAKRAGQLREEYINLASTTGTIFIDTPEKLTKVQKGFVAAANGAKVLASGIKTLLKSTIILAVIQAAVEAITWAWDKLTGAFKSFTGMDLSEQVNELDSVTQAIEATNNSLNKYKSNLQTLVDTKVISNQTMLNESIEEYTKALNKAIIAQMQLNSARGEGGKTLDFNSNNTWFTGADVRNMEDFVKQFEILQKAVQAGTDRFKALAGESKEVQEQFKGNWFEEFWNTAGDAAADFAAAQKAVIGDIQYRINNLDLSKGEEEIKKFLDLLDTPVYQVSLANIENLFPEDEYAKVLAANIKQIKEYYSQIKELENQAAVEAQKIQQTITDNNIQAIQNRFQRERAELENNYKKELQDAADNEELKLSITNKYNTQRQALLKSQGNEVRNIQNQINSNEIAAMQDGFQKRLAELENSRKQEIQAAQDSEILVNEQIAAINKKYDAQILEAKKEFYESRQKLLQDYSNQYKQLWNEVAEVEYEMASNSVQIKAQDKLEELGFSEENIENIREYYNQIRDIANEEAKKLAAINSEKTTYSTDESLNQEKQRNQERLQAIEQNYKDGLITKEDYDKAVQDENDLHYKRMEVITKEGEQKLVQIQKEYDQTAKNNNITAINERINAVSEAYGKIDAEVKVSKIGIIDYKATKEELTNAQKEYSNIMTQIAEERDNLQKSFDNKEISFNDFRQAKKELDNLEQEVISSQQSIGFQLDTLLMTVTQSITQYVGQYVSALGDIWSTYNEIQMMRFEQEQARLEEEYDMLEEAYTKQEELTQKHTDKLSEIEDELKTSRGDRRAHLIEQLNAEREAQLASLQEEQRIEKEKEANEKKQDALEKKRREQEKKNSIVQATINTYTAVTNALAVQPWFVGLALSAVALAMGMAQVAQIKKQKYAKGGLLSGKSHAQGGIPVGNTGIEVEGDEYIVNKRSTKNNLPLIDYINNSNKRLTREDLMNWYDSGKQTVTKTSKNKFATGGILPSIPNQSQEQTIVIEDDRPIVAQIVDIVNSADNYRQIQVLSGLSGKTV